MGRSALLATFVFVLVFAAGTSRSDVATDSSATSDSPAIDDQAASPEPGPTVQKDPFAPYDVGGPEAIWPYESLSVEERAAQKRVARSLEKLRAIFAKRGVATTAAVIAGIVSANSVQAAPVALATSITTTAVKGSAVAASTTTLVEGTLKIMTWIKMKMFLM